jgi:RimJ/RimL family protein N-acetyltransferase
MRLHVGALYVHDARGRIVSSNEWRPAPAPRFHLGRTSEGLVRRFRADLPDALCAELEALGEVESEIARALAAHAPIERVWTGPAYALPADLAPRPSARTIAIDATNADLLRGGFDAWLDDVPHRQPFLAALEDGRAVAVCASVRITAAAHEAGVETLAPARGRGHAADAVAAWADAVRRAGALPLYSTSSDNAASQRVAAKLGAQPIGTDFHVS